MDHGEEEREGCLPGGPVPTVLTDLPRCVAPHLQNIAPSLQTRRAPRLFPSNGAAGSRFFAPRARLRATPSNGASGFPPHALFHYRVLE